MLLQHMYTQVFVQINTDIIVLLADTSHQMIFEHFPALQYVETMCAASQEPWACKKHIQCSCVTEANILYILQKLLNQFDYVCTQSCCYIHVSTYQRAIITQCST